MMKLENVTPVHKRILKTSKRQLSDGKCMAKYFRILSKRYV